MFLISTFEKRNQIERYKNESFKSLSANVEKLIECFEESNCNLDNLIENCKKNLKDADNKPLNVNFPTLLRYLFGKKYSSEIIKCIYFNEPFPQKIKNQIFLEIKSKVKKGEKIFYEYGDIKQAIFKFMFKLKENKMNPQKKSIIENVAKVAFNYDNLKTQAMKNPNKREQSFTDIFQHVAYGQAGKFPMKIAQFIISPKYKHYLTLCKRNESAYGYHVNKNIEETMSQLKQQEIENYTFTQEDKEFFIFCYMNEKVEYFKRKRK